MNVDRSRFVLGGVPYIDIDGIDYPISNDGCVIEKVSDIGITPVVGRPEPRIVERTSHYTVTVSMLENTLEMLKIAWNLPNTISYGGAYDYLYLGISDAPAAHTLAVRGWGGLSGDISKRLWREWYFRKATSYEPQPQDLGVGNTVFIPVRFYCYADSAQAAGQEFGYIQQELNQLLQNGGFETAGAGGGDVFAIWSETPGSGTIGDETTLVFKDGHACKLTMGAGDSVYVHQNFSVSSGRKHLFTFYTRGDGTNQGRYSVYDVTNSAFIVDTTNTGIAGTSYLLFAKEFTTPATCVDARIHLLGSAVDGSIAYFDEVKVYDLHK
jgi:hypothetical protein